MQKFIKSGGAFFVLALLFMVMAAVTERPAVYISLGALWLILALAMVAKNKQKPSSEK